MGNFDPLVETRQEEGDNVIEPNVDVEDVLLGGRIAETYSKLIRYCPELDMWFVWDGKRWARDVTHRTERFVMDMAHEALIDLARQPDPPLRDLKFWRDAMKMRRIATGLQAARSESKLIARHADLDVKPMVLNCASGTIDLVTGTIRPADPSDLLTRCSPVSYDPDADRSLLNTYLARVMPDPDTRRYLRDAMGYVITGRPWYEKILYLSGPTRSGKSTLISAVNSALGDYAATADFQTFLERKGCPGSNRGDLVRLAGRRFVSSVETEEGAKLAGGLLKMLSGGDTITAAAKYKDEIEYKPIFTLCLVSNNLPRADDEDAALWERLELIPFDQTIPVGERDPTIKERLADPLIGGPAILAWMVEGALAVQKTGLVPADTVTVATSNWRADNDPLREYLREQTFVSQNNIRFSELNANYKGWCQLNSHRPLGGAKLSRRVQAAGFPVKPGTDNVKFVIGLGVKQLPYTPFITASAVRSFANPPQSDAGGRFGEALVDDDPSPY